MVGDSASQLGVWGIRLRQVLLCAIGQDTQGGPDRLQTRLGHTSQAEGPTNDPDRLRALRGGPDVPKARRAVQIDCRPGAGGPVRLTAQYACCICLYDMVISVWRWYFGVTH